MTLILFESSVQGSCKSSTRAPGNVLTTYTLVILFK